MACVSGARYGQNRSSARPAASRAPVQTSVQLPPLDQVAVKRGHQRQVHQDLQPGHDAVDDLARQGQNTYLLHLRRTCPAPTPSAPDQKDHLIDQGRRQCDDDQGRRIWLETGRVAAQLSDRVIFSPIAAAGRIETDPRRDPRRTEDKADAEKQRQIADCVSSTDSPRSRSAAIRRASDDEPDQQDPPEIGADALSVGPVACPASENPVRKPSHVLAYSGGLDTSIILKWLQTEYGCEVVTFTADLGQGEELEPARKKAEMLGVSEIYIEDLREEFVRDFVFPMFRANALYEGLYLLGTSIARPLISKRLVEIAAETGADAVPWRDRQGQRPGAVRTQAYALNPDIKVIAPWREWDLTSRTEADRFRRTEPDPDRQGQARRSAVFGRREPAAHLVRGQGAGRPRRRSARLRLPAHGPPRGRARHARDGEITFEKGDAVAINGEAMSPATILTKLNELGGKHGVGRLDLVENRFVGMKSRGIYETPGGTILLEAHRGIEQITLDRGAGHLKDDLMPRYAELIYNGFWFSPEREMLQALIDKSPGACDRHRAREALQGLRPHRRPLVRPLALFRGACDLRGGRRRLRPEGRAGLHPAERAAAEAAGGILKLINSSDLRLASTPMLSPHVF
jgi:argininosuccinate synthase